MQQIFNRDGKATYTLDPTSYAAQAFIASGKPFRFAPLPRIKIPKLVKPTLDQIYQRGQDAVAQSFPDGDPIDYLGPYLTAHRITFDDVNRAFKKHEKKEFYAYLAAMWDDSAADAIGDAKRGFYDAYSAFYSEENGVIEAKNNPWK